MDDILNKNLKLLEKHQPNVYQKLIDYIKGNYKPRNKAVERILLARQDDLVINIVVSINKTNYLLCNHDDPVNESYGWISKYVDPSNKADVVFGIGMGFHLEVLLTSFQNKKVIIIEPDIELFYQILKIRNLELIIKKSEIFTDENIDVILGRVHELFWDTGSGGIQCQPLEVYSLMFGNLWDELRSRFIKLAENFTVDISTRRCFGELWIDNNIKNARRLKYASNAHGLIGGFSGVPGILVSAGPSLAKNVHLLNGLKDKCVIMAAGTAANILVKHDVIPHFMVGIDAVEGEAEIERRSISTDIYFIYSNQMTTGLVENYSGPKFFINYPVDVYTAKFLKYAGIESNFFLSGPSVANTCFDILFKMGCSPIIIIGQDLAFTGGSNYAGEAPGSVLDRIQGPQKEGLVLTKDIYDNDVYTQISYISMKNWFEGYFEKIKDRVEIINATEGGLNIQHSRNEKLADVVNAYSFTPLNINGRIKYIHEANRFPEIIDDKLNEYMEDSISEINRLEEHCRKQLKLVDLIKRDVYHPSKDKRAFDKMVYRIGGFTDSIMQSPIYNSLLKNLIEIDFYLIKAEVDRAVKELGSYTEIKNIYINAIKEQNRILSEKLDKIKHLLKNT